MQIVVGSAGDASYGKRLFIGSPPPYCWRAWSQGTPRRPGGGWTERARRHARRKGRYRQPWGVWGRRGAGRSGHRRAEVGVDSLISPDTIDTFRASTLSSFLTLTHCTIDTSLRPLLSPLPSSLLSSLRYALSPNSAAHRMDALRCRKTARLGRLP
jgi:hypothetical protein